MSIVLHNRITRAEERLDAGDKKIEEVYRLVSELRMEHQPDGGDNMEEMVAAIRRITARLDEIDAELKRRRGGRPRKRAPKASTPDV